MRKLLFVAIAALSLSSCTNISKSVREPYARVEFNKGDFEFSDQVKATAQTTRILSIDWARLFNKEMGSVEADKPASLPVGLSVADLPVIGNVVGDLTSNYALYKLMEENPGYDVIFYPQYKVTTERPIGIGAIYSITTVEVTAKLARIKK